MSPRDLVLPAVAAALPLLVLLASGSRPGERALRRLAGPAWGAALLVAGLGIPAAGAALLSGERPAALAVGVSCAAAASLALLARRGGASPGLADAALFAAVLVPAFPGLADGAWASGGAELSPSVGRILAAGLALAAFGAARGMEGLGLRWRLRLEDLGTAGVGALVFALVAVPAVLIGGRAAIEPRWSSGTLGLWQIAALVLVIVLPEEILFRGVLFSLLQRVAATRSGPGPALLLSALAYGLARAACAPSFDLAAAALFAWAGVCLGWCVLRSGGLMPAILAHATIEAAALLMLEPAAS